MKVPKMWNSIYIFNLLYCIANAITYKTYERVPATSEEIAEFEAKNNADICLVTFEPCREDEEWRRPDGSCNNLKYPSHGTIHTPEWRLLPANYSEGFRPRKMKSGEDFPLARWIRSILVKVGVGIDPVFATSSAYFSEFTTSDFVSAHDTLNYVLERPYCCEPQGLTDPMCVPNLIPPYDDVHRYSGYHCINMTKPRTFQSEGCAPDTTVPSRVDYATPHMDLSAIYWVNGNATSTHNCRLFEGGKLKEEVVNGISLPSDATNSTTCFIKQARETGCTRNVPNTLAGTNIFTAWFWRFHNYLADRLVAINPCWDDEKIYQVARDINIARCQQIIYYEFFAKVLGKENLIKDGVLHTDNGFRDIYNPNIAPAMSNEFIYFMRRFHMTQNAIQHMFDSHDNFVGTFPMVNLSLGVQELPYNDIMRQITRGLTNQASAAYGDGTVHPDIANRGLGQFQKTLDILTNDLAKGRENGVAPYSQYRDFCTNYEKKHEKFEDFIDVMDETNIELLRYVYEESVNVEAMAGTWLEFLKEGAYVPSTMYCVLVKQLKRSIVTDRFWYERPNRPHPLTEPQLEQIRHASLASLICTVGDDVTHIQPQAFLRIGPGNEKISCAEIPKIDLSPWKDDACCK